MFLDEGCEPLSADNDLADGLPTNESHFTPDRKRRFQRQIIEASELHRYLVDELSDRLGGARPHVILCCGKCRVGSTPLANVFGHAGLAALYQPIKTLLRYKLVGELCPPWSLATDQPVVFLKETFGPYVAAECAFSPLQVLLDVGFRRQDITLVVMERDPLATIESWWRCWQSRIAPDDLMRTFVRASFNVHQLAVVAADHGIQVAYYLHEEAREPETAVSRLFDTLGLSNLFDVSILRSWTASDSLRGANTAVRFFSQPRDYVIEDIHLELDEYRFVPCRPGDPLRAPLHEVDAALWEQLCRFHQYVRERSGCLNSS
ncbi:MAG: hypothetical protein ACRBM6_04355 [Geminicoccales bacterium]